MSDDNKYKPVYDDRKSTDRVYVGKQHRNSLSGEKYRYVEKIMSEESAVGFMKQSGKVTLYTTEKGKQKIQVTLHQTKEGQAFVPVLHISRLSTATGNPAQIGGITNDWQACLAGEQIRQLYTFLAKICSIDFSNEEAFSVTEKELAQLPDNIVVGSSFGEIKEKKDIAEMISYLKSNKDFFIEAKKLGVDINALYKAASIKEREKTLQEFEERLKDSSLLEDKKDGNWQDWFSKNRWLLGSNYVKILDRRTINENSKCDFLASSYGGFLEVIEIKNPNLDEGRLFKEAAVEKEGASWSSYYPTTELTKAISQSLEYIHEIEMEISNPQKDKKFEKCGIVKPSCTLLFGRSNNFDEDQHKTLRIMNSHYNSFSIITYDQLLDRAKRMLEFEEQSA